MMSKLHELKIKYEQSQLAERTAWGVWQVQCIKGVTSPSGEPLRGYRDASAALRQASNNLDEDALTYLKELNKDNDRMLGHVRCLLIGLVVITVVVTFGMLIT
jgi:hypothetical protein